MKKDYISTTKLAELLGISRIAVYRKIKKGQIPAKKLDKSYLIPRRKFNHIFDKKLSESEKGEIDVALEKIFCEYGEAIRLLGKE